MERKRKLAWKKKPTHKHVYVFKHVIKTAEGKADVYRCDCGKWKVVKHRGKV